MSARTAASPGPRPVEGVKERLRKVASALPEKGRAAHAEAFSRSDLELGRYSRLLLDLDALPFAPARLSPPLLVEGKGRRPKASKTHAGTLREAWSADPGLCEGLLEARSPWDHLVLAGWEEGAFLRPATGGETAFVTFGPQPGLVLEPVALDVPPGGEMSVVLHWPPGATLEPSLHVSLLRGRLGEGSRVKVFLLAEESPGHQVLSAGFHLGREASLDLFCLWSGPRFRVARLQSHLEAEGASFRETHMVYASGKEHFDLDSRTRLAARRQRSDVAVKAVAGGRSRVVFTGNVLMEKSAALSEAVLQDHVLLLSPEAHADSVPGLEIETLEVKAAHAASVGQVDEEELFYLQSRGLEPEAARRLVVLGFLRSLLERVPLPWAGEAVDAILEKRVGK
ncbi:MAG: SufB/SufD family protein [Acidobacteriota bacterium]